MGLMNVLKSIRSTASLFNQQLRMIRFGVPLRIIAEATSLSRYWSMSAEEMVPVIIRARKENLAPMDLVAIMEGFSCDRDEAVRRCHEMHAATLAPMP